jgi:hypothetical protein
MSCILTRRIQRKKDSKHQEWEKYHSSSPTCEDLRLFTCYTDKRKTKREGRESNCAVSDGGGWSLIRRQEKALTFYNIFLLGKKI